MQFSLRIEAQGPWTDSLIRWMRFFDLSRCRWSGCRAILMLCLGSERFQCFVHSRWLLPVWSGFHCLAKDPARRTIWCGMKKIRFPFLALFSHLLQLLVDYSVSWRAHVRHYTHTFFSTHSSRQRVSFIPCARASAAPLGNNLWACISKGSFVA